MLLASFGVALSAFLLYVKGFLPSPSLQQNSSSNVALRTVLDVLQILQCPAGQSNETVLDELISGICFGLLGMVDAQVPNLITWRDQGCEVRAGGVTTTENQTDGYF